MSLYDNTAASFTTARTAVTTAGTAVPLSTTATRIGSVIIQAHLTNTGTITVGDSNVVASSGSRRGITLNPGDTITIDAAQLSSLYIDSTVNGEGVSYLAAAA